MVLLMCGAGLAVDPVFVWIGDPHLEQANQPQSWIDQTNWISANAVARNIQGVFCSGDFDNTFNTANLPVAWSNGWNTIDAIGIPYLSAPGNHDYDNNSPSGRLTTIFDTQLGYSRVSGKSWYGGFTGSASNRSSEYIKFTYGSRKFLFLALQFFPAPDDIAWATQVLLSNLDYEVVVITHGHLDTNAVPIVFTQVSGTCPCGPSVYSLPADSYAGNDITAWAKKFPNIRGIWSGHTLATQTRFGTQRVDAGVVRFGSLEADYQGDTPPSRVILLITVGTNSISVTGWNTTTDAEDLRWTPYTLPWAGPAVGTLGFPF